MAILSGNARATMLFEFKWHIKYKMTILTESIDFSIYLKYTNDNISAEI